MRFFSSSKDDKDDARKDDAPRSESQRLSTRNEKKPASFKTFVLGLATADKLASVTNDRIEEALRAALPKGSKVGRLEASDAAEAARRGLAAREGLRLFEVTLASGELPEALTSLCEKGLLEGQIDLAVETTIVTCKATGRSASVAVSADVDRTGLRYVVKTESSEVWVQYPPIEVHKRWLADDDYRAAYGRWRTQRSEEATTKPPRWHAAWPAAPSDEIGPPWIKLRPREGQASEFAVEFDDRMLLCFAFQGAEITIMRFNLKILSNKLTNEYAVYRSLPLSVESIPKDVQDRMNREPERFKPLRDASKFPQQFDLVRQAYEEMGGDTFRLETPPARPAAPAAPPNGGTEAPPARPAESEDPGDGDHVDTPRPLPRSAATPVAAPSGPTPRTPLPLAPRAGDGAEAKAPPPS